MARVLTREFKTLDKLRKANYHQLKKVKEIGPEIAESVHDFFEEKINQEMIDRLLDAGIKVKSVEDIGRTPLEGITFVFTGELDNYSRGKATDLVEALGGRATSSVSNNTDYLVVGDNPGSKLEEARELKVKIIQEDEFEEMVKKK